MLFLGGRCSRLSLSCLRTVQSCIGVPVVYRWRSGNGSAACSSSELTVALHVMDEGSGWVSVHRGPWAVVAASRPAAVVDAMAAGGRLDDRRSRSVVVITVDPVVPPTGHSIGRSLESAGEGQYPVVGWLRRRRAQAPAPPVVPWDPKRRPHFGAVPLIEEPRGYRCVVLQGKWSPAHDGCRRTGSIRRCRRFTEASTWSSDDPGP
jgi:hypothetical protein